MLYLHIWAAMFGHVCCLIDARCIAACFKGLRKKDTFSFICCIWDLTRGLIFVPRHPSLGYLAIIQTNDKIIIPDYETPWFIFALALSYRKPYKCLIAIAQTLYYIDHDVIWTRNLLIWSQTRYHCATQSVTSPVNNTPLDHFCSMLNGKKGKYIFVVVYTEYVLP